MNATVVRIVLSIRVDCNRRNNFHSVRPPWLLRLPYFSLFLTKLENRGNGQILHHRACTEISRPSIRRGPTRCDATWRGACDVDFLLVTFICLKNRRLFYTGALLGSDALHLPLIHPCPLASFSLSPLSFSLSAADIPYYPPSAVEIPGFLARRRMQTAPCDRCKFHKLANHRVDVCMHTYVHVAYVPAYVEIHNYARCERVLYVVFHECLQLI